MAIEVVRLADVILQVKELVRQVSDEACLLVESVERLQDTMQQVTQMRNDLDNAEADLHAALGQMTNSGPPLDDNDNANDTTDIPAADVPIQEEDNLPTTADIEAALKSAANQVQQANASAS